MPRDSRPPPSAIKRTLAMGLKWLGGVSLFAEAAWGPLERRKKRRKRDI